MELDNCVSDLESDGFEIQTFDIPACGVGAFHRRRRIWIVANSSGVGLGDAAGLYSFSDVYRNLERSGPGERETKANQPGPDDDHDGTHRRPETVFEGRPTQPRFVEEMMLYPVGWTDLKASAMPSSQ